ncbi:MAG: nucleoside monophosphate kinase [Candidatus Pacebacteria bacterium]|nr:nucleoside monophosphate kinase [Candidatus Paceibacterota bacterium]MDD3072134.1 nucleoside monophosphate kinase [Candidatus Paceibacterota bacterium]MDD3728801.1 nucleoside monophosphate kinase [Candidatus Paceibacterota bacterium]MDD4467441.1 nucleoside monophosphate kinase [Candidatus Paceibacterota bacterium]MDD5445635.1 nucleoside monophosphate kinase [Candidatus Paceibacterota bacterium]
MGEKNKKVLIIFGAPGAGKGTQAQLLSEALDFFYLETSKVLEENFKNEEDDRFLLIDGEKYDTLKEKKLWEEGILCSPPFVVFLIKKKIKKLFDAGESIILAGSPRTIYESSKVIPFLKELYGEKNIKTVLVNITPEETIKRNSKRRICSLMRHPIIYTEETKDLKKCPLDGSKLMKREGLDDVETIKIRLKEYESRTFPVVEDMKKQGIEVKSIDGSGSPVDIFEEIIKKLGEFAN